MSLLARHVAQLKSEELVLGCSSGFKGEAGTKFADIESTKICIVGAPSSKGYNGYTGIDQKIADASVGKAMEGKAFPARCLVTYERRTAVQKSSFEGRETQKDVELLVVVGIEYLSQVDFADVKAKNDDASGRKVA